LVEEVIVLGLIDCVGEGAAIF